jgi:PKD repeat protein
MYYSMIIFLMMKRTAILFVLAILVLAPFNAMASAPQVSCKAGTCSNLKITKVTINPTGKTIPVKVGFTSYISGSVKLVQYTVVNSKTGKVVGSSRSYCSKCTKKGICTCTCVIKEAGTYDVKVTAYGSGNCCVNLVKKAAFTVSPSKVSTGLVPSFKSIISGKKVTLKDTTSGAKPVKWNWNFGDGSRSTVQNPTHTYKKAGTYTVSLTVYSTDNSYKLVSNKIVIK